MRFVTADCRGADRSAVLERAACTIGRMRLPGFFIDSQEGEWGMGLIKNIFGSGKKEEGIRVCAPTGGRLVPLSEVSDPTFAEGILGKGAAVVPGGNRFFSPADGTVTTVFPTGHAAAITTDDGAEVLIHIGVDTVKLDGKYFTSHVKDGQKVSRGELLLEADLEQIKAAGYDTVTSIVICNTDDFAEVEMAEAGDVAAGDTVLTLRKS